MSGPNFKSFMRKFNVSKPTDMPDIPEEKMVDGRVVSQVKSETSEKRGSATSTVSNLSTSSTEVGVGPPKDPIRGREAAHTPQTGDLLFIPQDVQTPTTFGPRNEFTAVPTIITYSAGRGTSRTSVRQATPEDLAEVSGPNKPIISEVPQYPHIPPPSSSNNVPVIAPPPNFEPIRLPNHSPAPSDGSQTHPEPPRILSSRISHSDQSIRTSTTSFRTSSGSTIDVEPTVCGTPITSPGTPPQRGPTTSPKQVEVQVREVLPKTPPASVSDHSRNSSTGTQSTHTAYHDSPRLGTSLTYAGSDGVSQSRFEWDVSKIDRAHNWFTRWFIEWWFLEIASWIFSMICMGIIVVVLARFDGKPLPKWKMGITINAFISTFSGFAKSALLLPTAEALGQLKWNWFQKGEKKMMDFEVMDSASRGPLGAMVMLGKTKGVTLASVGAAIILLSLPLDLFFQQIVSFPLVRILDPTSNATISRAILYDPDPEQAWRVNVSYFSPDTQLESFNYPFMLAKGVTPGVTFNCPTGNCTYDPFYTLGVDFECKGISQDFLQFGCHNTSGDWLTSNPEYLGTDTSPNVTSCGYYMNIPGFMPQLMSGYEVQADGSAGEVMATRIFPLMDVQTNTQFFDGSISFKDVYIPIVDFVLVSTPDGFEGALRNSTPVVTECNLHWVVKLVNSTVSSGELIEESLETLQFKGDLLNPWDSIGSTLWVSNYSMTLVDTHSTTGRFSTFGVDNTTAFKVWAVWTELAPSSFNRPAPNNPVKSGPVLHDLWFAHPPQIRAVHSPSTPWDTPHNVTEHLGEAVNVMNQVIRKNLLSQRGRHDVAVGLAWQYVSVVEIRWYWIILPTLLLLFSLLFLIATVVRSTKGEEQVGIWKTSALAILFNGLGEDVQDYVGQGNLRMGYTRSRAKDLKVQLDD